MRVLVTGGGGFLGRHLARRLLQEGHDVTVFGRHAYPFLPASIQQVQGALQNLTEVEKACQGCDAVFHAAALTGIWGKPATFREINITGTDHVLEACRSQRVPRLVYTSSPSVVFGDEPLENADESTPYPETYLCDYPRSKAEAERRVLDANGKAGLLTVTLRPHLIWGPEDPHLIPRIVERARSGKLVRVGEGGNKVDITFIDNAVEGHVRALAALEPGSPAAGRVYFLSDGEPVLLWHWIDRLLEALDIPPVTRSISYATGKTIGGLMEGVYRVLGIQTEPRLTRFLAGQLALSHYFDISAARRDLGYRPVVSPQAGWERLIAWLKSRPVD